MAERGLPVGRLTRGKRGIVFATSTFVMCALAACGSSSDDEPSGSESGEKGDAAAVAAAQERVAPLTKPAEKIEVSTPLVRKPDAGKSVFFIRYNLPSPALQDPAMTAATKALGWKLTILAVDGTDPQSVSNAAIRAVNEKADFIAVNSAGEQALGPGLAAAKQAGVPVFLANGVGTVGGETNGIYGNTQADDSTGATLQLLDQMIVDSKGTGHTLLVNAPDFPVLAPQEAAAKKHLADNCSKCTLETRSIPPTDLGGDVAAGTVAALRQHPDITYVVTSYDALVNGLPEQLKAAGMKGIKIYVNAPSDTFVEGIRSGDYAAGIAVPFNDRVWLLVDQIARQSVGMDTDQAAHAETFKQLWTKDTVPPTENTFDPPDYEAQYKKLWLVP